MKSGKLVDFFKRKKIWGVSGTLTCGVGGASSEGWLAASVAEGNMGGGQADPPTSAEDGETRSEWSKLGQ